MATYTHQCGDCGKKFENLREMSRANEKIRCPKCKSRNTKRLVTSAVAIYKDSDFTKYRKESD